MLILLLGLSHSFAVQSAFNSKPATISIMKRAFEPLRSIPYIEDVTIHASSNDLTGPVKVLTHVTCDNGFECWGHGEGDGLLRACEDCTTDTLIKMTLYSMVCRKHNNNIF